MGILVIALSINPRPLSALELTLSGLIMAQVDTAGDNQNPHVIISNYRHDRRADKNPYRHDRNMRFSSKLNYALYSILMVSFF